MEHEDVQQRLLSTFNTRFNRTVARIFDGSHLTLPGLALPFALHPHQRAVIWRTLATGNTLFAHEVGAGKTFAMIATAMEMRRTGRARKPLITVPTHLLGQWREDIMRAYPAAKVLAFDEKDLGADKRQEAMARIAFGDWDMVLVPHSSFGLLRVSTARLVETLEQWERELTDAYLKAKAEDGKSVSTKQLAAAVDRIKDKIAKKKGSLEKKKDDALTWEQLGVDALFVDEAHAFKNLYYFSKMDNIRGLSRSESDRALDLFVKVQDINEQSSHRNLVLATATPIMNSIAEIFTMQRYLQPQALRDYGVENFDNWYTMFASALPTTEQRPDGSYQEVLRLRDYRNLNLLYRMVSQVMDYVGWEDMPYLQLPTMKGGKIDVAKTPAHPLYPQLKRWFSDRLANVKAMPPHVDRQTREYIAPARPDPLTGEPTGKLDNILTIMNDARLAAVDPRLVLGNRATDYKGSRLQDATDRIAKFWRAEKKNKGVALVFCDVGTPKDPGPLDFLRDVKAEDSTEGDSLGVEDEVIEGDEDEWATQETGAFNLYEAIKAALVKKGVPAREIAFIHQARNAAERLALFEAARRGDVRVLMASTDKGGTGMNIQARLGLEVEFDAPRAMRPGDIRQRHGRIIRQGNGVYKEVEIIRYVTNGTTDEWLYGLLGRKQKNITDFMRGDATVFRDDDPATLSIEEAQALATNDPRTIELIDLRSKFARLSAQAQAAERAIARAKADKASGQREDAALEDEIGRLREWVTGQFRSLRGEAFEVTVGGKTYTDRKDANAAIFDALWPVTKTDVGYAGRHVTYTTIGNVRGLELSASHVRGYREDNVVLFMKSPIEDQWRKVAEVFAGAEDRKEFGAGRNLVASLVDAYEGLPALLEDAKRDRQEVQRKVERADKVLASPPETVGRAKAAEARIAELEAELREEGKEKDKAAESKRLERTRAAEERRKAKAQGEDVEADDDVSTMRQRPAPAAGAPTSTEPLSPHQIVARLSEAFGGLPIKTGHFSQRALGVYKHKARVVRTKLANDLEVIGHELGHHVATILNLRRGRRPYSEELEALGADILELDADPGEKRKEGEAEFLRLYLSDPASAQNRAPLYLAAFEDALQVEPELKASIEQARTLITGFLGADSIARGLARIDFTGQEPDPKADWMLRFETAWVDDLAPIRRMVKELGTPEQILRNGYALARLARGAAMKADGFLRNGVRLPDGSKLSEGLEPALKPVAHQAREFAAYLVASRVADLTARGMKAGMTTDEAQAILDAFQSPEFDEARQAVYDFQDAVIDYAVQAGAVSPEQAVQMRALNPHYVPYQRVQDTVSGAFGGGPGSKIANRSVPIKRIKGSTRDIVNPLESIIRNTHTLVNMVEANRAMQALVAQAESTEGGGRFLEKVPAPVAATKFNLARLTPQIREALEDAGVELPDNLDEALDESAVVFTPLYMPTGKGGLVTVIQDGKRQWYAANDQALYDAITAIGPKHSDLVINLLMRPARLLRAGATLTVSFAARNPIRDTWTAYINSRYGFRLGYDSMRGLFEFVGNGELYQQFMNSGAGNAALVSADRNRIREELRRMGKSQRRAFLASIVRNPIELLRAISEATEVATRLGEFMGAVEKEGRTAEGYARAALAARDVTLDFARGGRYSKEANRYTAFFNARVQGWARLAEVFGGMDAAAGGGTPGPGGKALGGDGQPPIPMKEGPKGHWSPRRRRALGAVWRATIGITLQSLALWYLNHTDPDYHELPAWERNTYWHVPLGRAHGHDWARIPKPFEIGMIFGSFFEAAMDYMSGKDKKVADRLFPGGASSAWNVILSITPTAIVPALEAAVNYDTFRGRSIVNPYDTTLDPELQAGRWTSEAAKLIAPKLRMAPAKFDHLVYGYTAGLGRGIEGATDAGLSATGIAKDKRPSGGLARAPFVSAFYRETPRADAQSFQEFYETRDALRGALRSVDEYRASGDTAKAKARTRELDAEYGGDARLTAARIAFAETRLRTLSQQVNKAFEDPRLSPDDRRAKLNALYARMLNVVRQGLGKPTIH
ncbi:DEAD/DEAH box helicase family protein [bacterium]|nr:DEAD/DEAH box helicase family protein [bacterium]